MFEPSIISHYLQLYLSRDKKKRAPTDKNDNWGLVVTPSLWQDGTWTVKETLVLGYVMVHLESFFLIATCHFSSLPSLHHGWYLPIVTQHNNSIWNSFNMCFHSVEISRICIFPADSRKNISITHLNSVPGQVFWFRWITSYPTETAVNCHWESWEPFPNLRHALQLVLHVQTLQTCINLNMQTYSMNQAWA